MAPISPIITHPWDISECDAVLLQQELAPNVVQKDHFKKVECIAGVDATYDEQKDVLVAAVALLDASSLDLLELAAAHDAVRFPYVSGLFSFRELPPIIKALQKLETIPDLIICDGHGVAHPRRFGLACHLGVLFDIPTIGCSKTKLIGDAEEPGNERGDYSLLFDNGEVIGCVLRTRDNVKPVYVSVGHLVSLQTAREWVLKLAPRFRLPETTRLADQWVKRCMHKTTAGKNSRT